MRGSRLLAGVLAAVVAASLAAAAALAGPHTTAAAPSHLTIAYQPGMGYAALIVMKQQKTLEKQFPGMTVDWKVLSSGAAITDGVISGGVDVGAGGVGPFLTGWAKGVDWKFLPLNWGDLWLMAKDPAIKTVADLKGKKIAMPGPTSIQAVVLRKMAQAKLGDAHALDSGIISMDHPDAMQALLSGQIDAHLTSAPYQFQERIHGAHVVARSYQYFGTHTFLGVMITSKFQSQYPDFVKRFYADVVAVDTLIKKNPYQVAHILQDDAGGQPTWRQFKQWLAHAGLTYTTQPLGLMRFASFMVKTGQLAKLPASWKDLVIAPVQATKGS